MKKFLIALFIIAFMLTGCTNVRTNDYNTSIIQEEDVSKSLSVESEMVENDSEGRGKIQYYDSLDNHMQILYDAFISCEWQEVNDMLEELEKPDEETVAVYKTPSEGLSLVVEYMSAVHSWQAYLGEFLEGKKDGNGVMVSKRENGYVSTNVYIGSWNNNMPNGEGILSDYVSNIEHIFVGSFIDGKFDSNIQVYKLATSELYVDWETINPKFYVNAKWDYADLTFDDGKPIPTTIDVVEQYIELSELTAHELNYLNMENDGQYCYRIYDNHYNYVLSIGAVAPAYGYRGEVSFIYGTLFDLEDKEATYGVACYTTNRI